MTGITHKQAQLFMRSELDGLLTDSQRYDLDTHLRECEACRVESESLAVLTARLRSNFQARWDAQDGPSQIVMANIHSQTRRIIMSNRIRFGMRTLTGIGALIVLGFVINFAFAQLRNPSIAVSGTDTTNDVKPVEQLPLIAFTSDQNGNLDIYTMHADGSGLTNLTNNPAQDVSPVWSPDGKRIAFESDRNGFRQIFLMDADGFNVIQLTDDKADQWIGESYNLSLNLWSPDGKKLIFFQIVPGEENGMLYIIDANGENKKPLVNEAGKYSSPSWSPDGKHIAFIVLENSVARIYSTDADGNNLTNVTKTLPSDETLYPLTYSWSRNGQSISFIASNWNYLLGGGEGSPNYEWMAYEASLDGNTLVTNASTRSQIGGYWEGTYFLSGSYVVSSSPAFTWVRSDGTTTTANPTEDCQNLLDSNTGGYTRGYSTYKQSSNGNVVIGAYCPNGDKWLFWANSKGTVRPLLKTPIHVEGNTSNAMHLWAPADFIWSPDDKFIAFNIFSLGKTDMYIVNVNESLKDPSIQPFQIAIGNGSLYYSLSWQPVPGNNIAEEKPTPEPTQTSSYDGLIAFVSGQEAGNEEIYTMHADGSGLTNLTNNPATDNSPAWSPDGTRIAFGSVRSGDMDIYVMDADGSNLAKLTDLSGYEGFFSWSPDGQKIVYTSIDNYNDQHLIIMNADGSNKTTLTNEPGSYRFLSWSPDGQKFVFQKQKLDSDMSVQDTGTYIADIDGSNQHKLSTILDIEKIQWQDSRHFLGVSFEMNSENQPIWSIYRFDADGNLPLKLASYNTPIVALFEKTYVVERRNDLLWYSTEGTPTLLPSPLSSWSFAEICKTPGDQYLQETSHFISPDKKYSFVSAYCRDGNGTVLFLLMNEDGTEIHQLGVPITNTNYMSGDVSWSPDGKYVTVINENSIGDMRVGANLYLFNIEKMLNDPSVNQIQLTNDGAWKYGTVWQPQP